MPAKRKKDKHLPERVYYKHGAYHFVDMNNKWHRLGKTLAEMAQNWSEICEIPVKSKTMNDIFVRYSIEVVPTLAETTAKNTPYYIASLRTFFGEMSPPTITATDIYQYQDIRAKVSVCQANSEVNALSRIFDRMIRWGIVGENPCKEVKRLPEPSRDREVEDWEIEAVYKIANAQLKIAIDIVECTGLRQYDILRIMRANILEEGLKVRIHKFKKRKKFKIFTWTDRLRQSVNDALSIQKIKSIYVLCARDGRPYSRDGFKSMWQRLMKKAIEQKVIQERFTFHDLRARIAGKADKKGGREYARNLLGHASQKMTERYIRGATTVKSLK